MAQTTDADASTADEPTAALDVDLDSLTARSPGTVPDGASDRRERALTERMVVIPEIDEYGYCTGEYTMLAASGSEYDVTMDGADGREDCTCMDMSMYNPSEGCKHIQRVGLAAHGDALLPGPDQHAGEFVEAVLGAGEELEAAREAAADAGDEERENYIDRILTLRSEMAAWDAGN